MVKLNDEDRESARIRLLTQAANELSDTVVDQALKIVNLEMALKFKQQELDKATRLIKMLEEELIGGP